MGCGGLDGGEGGFFVVVAEFSHEFLGVGEVLFGYFSHFGYGGDVAEGGVGDDFFDCFGSIARDWDGLGSGEIGGGDLEAVEEETGAARVDAVGGDAAEDFADGLLDGGAVVGDGEIEDGAAGAAGFEGGGGDGFAVGVVVETKIFVAEGWAAAAESGGVDVAALEAFDGDGFGCFGWHAWWAPRTR